MKASKLIELLQRVPGDVEVLITDGNDDLTDAFVVDVWRHADGDDRVSLDVWRLANGELSQPDDPIPEGVLCREYEEDFGPGAHPSHYKLVREVR